jgi:hypothetical protein
LYEKIIRSEENERKEKILAGLKKFLIGIVVMVIMVLMIGFGYAARNGLSLVPKSLKKIDEVMYLKNMENKNLVDENKNIKVNASKVVSKGNLGTIPLRILTSDSEANADSKWKSSQEQFKNWSVNRKQMIVPNTKHYIHQYAPEAVNNQILELINNIK